MFINHQAILTLIIFFLKSENYDFMNIIEGKVAPPPMHALHWTPQGKRNRLTKIKSLKIETVLQVAADSQMEFPQASDSRERTEQDAPLHKIDIC